MTETGRATRVVLAPDKFKGSLTAAEVAEALAAGMVDVLPQLETIMFPVADGGDGTVASRRRAATRSLSMPSALLVSRCRRRTRWIAIGLWSNWRLSWD